MKFENGAKHDKKEVFIRILPGDVGNKGWAKRDNVVSRVWACKCAVISVVRVAICVWAS